TECFGLEALTAAVGTRIVRPISREKHAHVHLVSVLLEPAEETLHAIPVFRPGLAVFLAVTRLAIDDVGLLLGGERGEGNVQRNLFLPREDEQIFFRVAVDLAFPAFDRAAGDGDRVIGNREAVIDFDHAAEAAAFWA